MIFNEDEELAVSFGGAQIVTKEELGIIMIDHLKAEAKDKDNIFIWIYSNGLVFSYGFEEVKYKIS